LAEALKWPSDFKHTHARVIRVAEDLHRTFPGSDKLQVLEFIAKNVGVRRARGEYVLVTNPDILFPEALIKYLAESSLSTKSFYRTARYDVTVPASPIGNPDEYLAYCREHVTRINGMLGTFFKHSGIKDVNQRLWNVFGYFVWRIKFFPLDMPFTNASGDFMLMHRNHWQALRGYAEIVGTDKYGFLHLDAFNVYSALFLGLKQVKLSGGLRIYHLEHGRPRISNLAVQAVEDTRNKLLKERKPVIINDENWGLGQYDLPEIHVG
ncbi:MAG TPA: hypothetical protein VMB24_04215, partial [Dehalococcoidales bacterium]|nr:hypothetical protein [Dehalococcoidales bacterium]